MAVAGNVLVLDTLAGEVLALDLRTGQEIWKRALDNQVMSTPLISNNLVVIGSGANDTSLNSGAFAYGGGPNGSFPAWGRREGDHVEAFDLRTGGFRWKYRTAGEDMPTGTIVDGRVVYANGDFHAYALRLLSGAAIWRKSLAGLDTMASATPVAPHNVVTSVCADFATRAATYAIDPRNGNVLWAVPYGNCDSSPTYGDARVFVSGMKEFRSRIGYSGLANVSALDARSGALLWTYNDKAAGLLTAVGSSERAIAGTYANGVFYDAFPTTDTVLAFDSRGEVRWRFVTQSPVKMSPVICSDRIYFGDTAGLLYTVDSQTGRLVSAQIYKSPFSTSPPIIVGATLLVANGRQVIAQPISGGSC